MKTASSRTRDIVTSDECWLLSLRTILEKLLLTIKQRAGRHCTVFPLAPHPAPSALKSRTKQEVMQLVTETEMRPMTTAGHCVSDPFRRSETYTTHKAASRISPQCSGQLKETRNTHFTLGPVQKDQQRGKREGKTVYGPD